MINIRTRTIFAILSSIEFLVKLIVIVSSFYFFIVALNVRTCFILIEFIEFSHFLETSYVLLIWKMISFKIKMYSS